MSLEYNDRAKRLLSESGFECEPKPEWIEGKVPDFFCTGPADVWAEVKSLDEPEEMKIYDKALPWLRSMSRSVQHGGRASPKQLRDLVQKAHDAMLAKIDKLITARKKK